VRHAISEDGNRVILEAGEGEGGKGLYLHDVATGEAIRLDVVQGGTGPSQGESYQTASSDASRIFFLDSGHLTATSSQGGADLYEYNLNAPAGSRLTDLTVDRNSLEAAGVLGVIEASSDGSYVYFAATGVLAPGAKSGAENLYLGHDGAIELIATLSNSDKESYQWNSNVSSYGELFARVSPNGQWLAFMSNADLTGDDTADAINGLPDDEVYLYNAGSGRLVCASCNPTGARPVGLEDRETGEQLAFDSALVKRAAANVPPWSALAQDGRTLAKVGADALYQPRYLSDSGRLFFDSSDALVPQDVDGTEDVYEYEPQGVGDCEGPASSSGSRVFEPARAYVLEGRADESLAGCVGLISSGTSPAESVFLDASETGGDVFFLTLARLAPQDYDEAYDIYDAHECTSAAPCYPVATPPPPCEDESSCRAPAPAQPALYGAPASATFSGAGNFTPTVVPAKPTPRALTRAQKLAKALRTCRKERSRTSRMRCEKQAKHQYRAEQSRSSKKKGH
jgi:WD40-like Beta Propeller Repeat